jgi:hypothetical protein
MDPAKIDRWLRFREQVLQNPGWPRGLWFAALDDGLRAALGEQSPLLADFERDRAELVRLERRASGSYQDARRVVQLEAQIRQLVDLADRAVTGAQDAAPAAGPAVAAPVTAVADEPRRAGWRVGAAGLAAGALVALGIAGASVYSESRIRAQGDLQMARIDRLLAARDVTLRAEIERRLAAQNEAAGGVPDELRGRVARLGRTLDQLSLDVSSLEMRLPALDQEVERISYGTGRMADDLARAGVEIDGLKTATPELTAWLARQKKELEQSMQGGRDALGGITGRVQSLAGEVDQSRKLLVDLNQSLVAGLEQARADGVALQAAVDEMRATGQQVARLMQGAEARVQAAQGTMQAKIDRMLSGLAEQADLAVLRGGDVVRRAEGEIARRIATASEAALKAVADERAVKLAALAEQVSKTQSELEQTRTGMLASWQRLDASVGARQSEVLTSLDAYAGTIGVRVEELLQALDLMVARSGG